MNVETKLFKGWGNKLMAASGVTSNNGIAVGNLCQYLLAKSMYFEAALQSRVSVLFYLQKISSD